MGVRQRRLLYLPGQAVRGICYHQRHVHRRTPRGGAVIFHHRLVGLSAVVFQGINDASRKASGVVGWAGHFWGT